MKKDNKILIIACGAIAREIKALINLNGWAQFDIKCLSPELHNWPEKIPQAVYSAIKEARRQYQKIFVAYADCGTGGQLDHILAKEGIERLPGAHCYEVFAGQTVFNQQDQGSKFTFYLTDFLALHFQRLVIEGLGIDRHPELRDVYFKNYRNLLYLSQTKNEALIAKAKAAASILELEFSQIHTGYGMLASSLTRQSCRAK